MTPIRSNCSWIVLTATAMAAGCNATGWSGDTHAPSIRFPDAFAELHAEPWLGWSSDGSGDLRAMQTSLQQGFKQATRSYLDRFTALPPEQRITWLDGMRRALPRLGGESSGIRAMTSQVATYLVGACELIELERQLAMEVEADSVPCLDPLFESWQTSATIGQIRRALRARAERDGQDLTTVTNDYVGEQLEAIVAFADAAPVSEALRILDAGRTFCLAVATDRPTLAKSGSSGGGRETLVLLRHVDVAMRKMASSLARRLALALPGQGRELARAVAKRALVAWLRQYGDRLESLLAPHGKAITDIPGSVSDHADFEVWLEEVLGDDEFARLMPSLRATQSIYLLAELHQLDRVVRSGAGQAKLEGVAGTFYEVALLHDVTARLLGL